MKKLSVFRFLGILFILLSFTAAGFAQDAERDKISAAILSGNAKTLSTYFVSSIDLTILEAEDVYSKEQAEVIIAKFFNDNKPTAFEIKHQGKSKLDDYFYIGDLTTSKGKYRLTFFLKKEKTGFLIKQLRLEPGD